MKELDAKLNLSNLSRLSLKELIDFLPILHRRLPPPVKVMATINHSYVWVGSQFFILSDPESQEWLKAALEEKEWGKVDKISQSSTHIFMLTQQGILTMIGDNKKRAFGTTTDVAPVKSPFYDSTQLMSVAPFISRPIQVVAGDHFSMALTPQGIAYYCGVETSVGIATSVSGIQSRWTKFSLDLQQISACRNHIIALTKAGVVITAGGDKAGWTPVNIPQWTKDPVIQVVTAPGHSMALTQSGKVWGCGDNNKFQLGLRPGSPSGWRLILDPHKDKVVQLSLGESHSVALMASGEVWVCGDPSEGQLGLESKDTGHVWTRVRFPSPVASISAGAKHTLVVTVTDQIWGCGSNQYGQLDCKPSKTPISTWTLLRTPAPADVKATHQSLYDLADLRTALQTHLKVFLEYLSGRLLKEKPKAAILDNLCLGVVTPGPRFLNFLKTLPKEVRIVSLANNSLSRWRDTDWDAVLSALPPTVESLDISGNRVIEHSLRRLREWRGTLIDEWSGDSLPKMDLRQELTEELMILEMYLKLNGHAAYPKQQARCQEIAIQLIEDEKRWPGHDEGLRGLFDGIKAVLKMTDINLANQILEGFKIYHAARMKSMAGTIAPLLRLHELRLTIDAPRLSLPLGATSPMLLVGSASASSAAAGPGPGPGPGSRKPLSK